MYILSALGIELIWFERLGVLAIGLCHRQKPGTCCHKIPAPNIRNKPQIRNNYTLQVLSAL